MEHCNDNEDTMDHLSDHHLGPSILPTSIAKTISFIAGSSSVCLRLGTIVGEVALDTARVGTLTTLELARAAAERVLSQAGRDVTNRSVGRIGRIECENLLDRSISTLHATITHVSFAASTGFFISSMALSSVSGVSQQLLTAIDSILGSTDSSRAIASIVTLIRREFQNPATGEPGETVGFVDLIVGICGLALLQRWCSRLTDLEAIENRLEEVVWDVVVLDDGRRVDVTGSSQNRDSEKIPEKCGHTFQTILGKDEILFAQNASQGMETTSEDGLDKDLRRQILQNFTPSTRVLIATETDSTKTTTVEVVGTEVPNLSFPSGAIILEESIAHDESTDKVDGLTAEQRLALLVPRYRVVYRMLRHRLHQTTIDAQGENSRLLEADQDASTDGHHRTESLHSEALNLSDHAVRKQSHEALDDIRDATKSNMSPSSVVQMQSLDQISREPPLTLDKETLPISTSNSQFSENTNSANQKRSRRPASSTSNPTMSPSSQDMKVPLLKRLKSSLTGGLENESRESSGIRALALGSKESSSSMSPTKDLSQIALSGRPAWNNTGKLSMVHLPKPKQPIRQPRPVPLSSQRTPDSPPYYSSKSKGRDREHSLSRESTASPKVYEQSVRIRARHPTAAIEPLSPRGSSNGGSIPHSRRNSLVSQTEIRPMYFTTGDETSSRGDSQRNRNTATHHISENNMHLIDSQPLRLTHRRRSSSIAQSIYTISSDTYETDMIFAPPSSRGFYNEQDALNTLSRTCYVKGLFPQHHIVRNLARFARFASASYGSQFMRVMGISTATASAATQPDEDHHYEHNSFSNHTQLPASTILLSSFNDPEGGTDSSGETNTGVPMVHFISLDHESKSVVLTCRGTLGFEDILTDMTCDYDDLLLDGQVYKVHKGIHASAVRLLSGAGSRVITTIAAALNQHPDYGLVMCGHSLGGSVVSLLAIMISIPAPLSDSSFVTSSQPRYTNSRISTNLDKLPAGRPIHVYAYGPPATLSASLRIKTRGLITTIINGQDIVPFLSLGVLHDLQSIALAFKTDKSGAKGEVRARVWAGLTSSFANKWYGEGHDPYASDDDEWSYAALKALRVSMLNRKLVPPGECFIVETTSVLHRHMFLPQHNDGPRLGKPATRAVLKYVRVVEKRFGELQFGGSMLLDHSPGRYEANLAVLAKGVVN